MKDPIHAVVFTAGFIPFIINLQDGPIGLNTLSEPHQ
jgi:hypothetical protein